MSGHKATCVAGVWCGFPGMVQEQGRYDFVTRLIPGIMARPGKKYSKQSDDDDDGEEHESNSTIMYLSEYGSD